MFIPYFKKLLIKLRLRRYYSIEKLQLNHHLFKLTNGMSNSYTIEILLISNP